MVFGDHGNPKLTHPGEDSGRLGQCFLDTTDFGSDQEDFSIRQGVSVAKAEAISLVWWFWALGSRFCFGLLLRNVRRKSKINHRCEGGKVYSCMEKELTGQTEAKI